MTAASTIISVMCGFAGASAFWWIAYLEINAIHREIIRRREHEILALRKRLDAIERHQLDECAGEPQDWWKRN
jgi:hypothetical protein